MATPILHSSANEQPLRVCFGPYELDEAEARVTFEGEPVPLPPKPFAVLCALARTPQRLVTTNDLLDRVWGHRFVTESVLKSAISDVRAALQDDSKQPRYIETVARRGYRFIADMSAPALRYDATQPSSSSYAPSAVTTLVGRSRELQRLRSAWARANAGTRQIVWVAGEAGVGKSTLIEAFATEIGEAHCAHGHCVEQRAPGESYLPALEALTSLCHADPSLADLIRAVAPSWLSRLPWLCSPAERDALRSELSGAGETRMLREFGELMDRYTQDRPLLLVTEDLHWSDSATVQLVNYIARRRGKARLLWVASFRLTEIIAADHPLESVRRELRLHGLCDEIVLDAFSPVEVGEYLARRVPALAAQEPFVRALHDRTDGLPLFVAEVVHDLAGREQMHDAASPRLDVARPVPESLTGIVERYVAELSPDQRVALEAASVCGGEFRVTTVARALGADVASIAETCAELARSQRWLKDITPARHESDARYAFRHGLYRKVLYQRMGPLARAEWHRKLALSGDRDTHDHLPNCLLRPHAEPADKARCVSLVG